MRSSEKQPRIEAVSRPLSTHLKPEFTAQPEDQYSGPALSKASSEITRDQRISQEVAAILDEETFNTSI